MKKNNVGLVEWARKMVGQAYWHGTCCFPCTDSLYASKSAQYPSHYTESRSSRYREDISVGRIATDDMGLMLGYLWDKQGRLVYNADTDIDGEELYKKAEMRGPISEIPEIPGLIVYRDGHVGVYEGDGLVVEAKDFEHGVICTQLSDAIWTYWIALPWISYDGFEALFENVVVIEKSIDTGSSVDYDNVEDLDIPGMESINSAIVVGAKTGLTLYSEPSREANAILQLPFGSVVDMLSPIIDDEFVYVRYGDVFGYCTRGFLSPVSVNAEKLFSVRTEGVTRDVVIRIRAIYPGAIVTETET